MCCIKSAHAEACKEKLASPHPVLSPKVTHDNYLVSVPQLSLGSNEHICSLDKFFPPFLPPSLLPFLSSLVAYC